MAETDPARLHSGRQTLATARTAGSENFAAAFGGETRTEAMAALANQLAGLIGAFHSAYSCSFSAFSGARDKRTDTKEA